MGRIAFVTWDGGGNVAVTAGIAAALRTRGHAATIIGPRSIQSAVQSLGVGYAELGIAPPRTPQQRLRYLLDVAHGTDAMLDGLRGLTGRLRADALVVDCNLNWALQTRMAPRTAVLVHTALGLYLPVWQSVLDAGNEQRAARGMAALASVTEAWAQADLLLVASLANFDQRAPAGGLRPVYVGPVSSPRRPDSSPPPIRPARGRPRVLISYSTDGLQNAPHRVQTALDALAGLPVAVLASTSAAFSAAKLSVPANATVLDYVPHDSIMATAALAVCHAGHGTTMAALSHGVPLICIPGLGRDQAPIAARVSELGLGIALTGDATASAIRGAATTILADRSYRLRARAFATRAGQTDGAARAATELLAMIDENSQLQP